MTLSIFHIGFSATVDGPGQRMVIYCKGCNLRCPWCAAPESIGFAPQVLFYPERVTDPAGAIAACPHGAVRFDGKSINRNIEVCAECSQYDCVEARHPAFELIGQKMGIEALAERAKRYKPFFGRAGGVTVGGGEPTCQYDSLRELLSRLKNFGIQTAIETNGTCADLPHIYDLIDLLYIDIKHPDPARYPGSGGDRVLGNISKRYSHGGNMVVRIPLMSGYNADLATMHSLGKALSSVGTINVEVLPYHTRGLVKWKACGMQPLDSSLKIPAKNEVNEAVETLCSYGLNAQPGR